MPNFPTPLEEVIPHNVIKYNKTGGPTLDVGQMQLLWRALGENTGYTFSIFEMTVVPGMGIPLHKHPIVVATDDIGAEVATLLTGPAWSGAHVIELGSMVSADEVASQLGEVLKVEVKAFAIPRAGWAEAFEQFGIPKGHTGGAEEMYESINAGWMDLGVTGTERVAGTTSARDVFAAA